MYLIILPSSPHQLYSVSRAISTIRFLKPLTNLLLYHATLSNTSSIFIKNLHSILILLNVNLLFLYCYMCATVKNRPIFTTFCKHSDINKTLENTGFPRVLMFFVIISLRTNTIFLYHFSSSSNVLNYKAFCLFSVSHRFVIFNINKHH